MKITVIGAGGAFAGMGRGNSSFLVEHNGHRILIDCGSTVPYILRDEMGIPLQSITDIIITHPHSDHAGGLELILHACRWMGGNLPTVIAHHTVQRCLDLLLDHLRYEKDFGIAYCWRTYHTNVNPTNPCGGLPITFYKTKHVGNMPSAAVKLGDLAVSGDTREPVQDEDFWNAKLVFHDADYGPDSGVHCPVGNLNDYLETTGAKAWTYHCHEAMVPFGNIQGVLQKGQEFLIMPGGVSNAV